MDQDLLLLGVGIEIERRLEYNLYRRQLRDQSDPFTIPFEEFRRMYRFPPEVARDVFMEVDPYMTGGRRLTKLPKVIRFLSALHFVAHGSYQKSVSKDYHCSMSQPAVSRAITEVCNILNEHFLRRYVKFPTIPQEIQQVKEGFFEKFNFSGVVGAIDCTRIAIVAPPLNNPDIPPLIFLNRKRFYSLNCQIVCDSNLKILNINCRYPGSVHDAAIWSMSDVKFFLENNYTWRPINMAVG